MANNKDPKYIAVYEQLLKEIQNGSYMAGQQLPVETELAEKYKVSRNTLRQAIMLLAQEGYVSNHQGKGTFVLQNYPEDLSSYENVSNPLKKYSRKDILKIDTEYDIIKASKEIQSVFNIDSSKLCISVRCTYHTEDGPVGFSNAVIPYDLFAESRIPMDDTQSIFDFYMYQLSRKDIKGKCILALRQIDNKTDDDNLFSSNRTFICFEETYKDKSLNVIIHQNLYFVPDNYEIKIYKTFN